MKLFVVGLMAIALVGCNNGAQYNEAVEAVKEFQDDLELSVNREAYRANLDELEDAIEPVRGDNREKLDEIYGYYEGAYKIWSCTDSVDCGRVLTQVGNEVKGVNLESDTDPDTAIQALWILADSKSDSL